MKTKVIRIITAALVLTAVIAASGAGFSVSADDGDTAASGFGGWDKGESFAIVPVHSGSTALDLAVSENRVIIYKAHRNGNQAWKVQKKGDYYAIENVQTGNVLEDGSGSAAKGTNITTSKYSGSDSQLWKLVSAEDGTYFIASKTNEKMVLDVSGESMDNGANVMIHELHRQANQRFRFVHVSTVEPEDSWGASRHDCYSQDFDIWDGGVDTDWYYKNKDAAVFKVESARQFAGIAKLVSGNTTDFYGRTIILRRDINLAGIEWPRIGTHEHPFRGSFNGMGHAITGLSITSTGESYGLFGEVNGGCITDLAVKGTVSGDWNTGGVVGNMPAGHIVNVYSEVTIPRATDDNAGGICGRLGYGGYIEHCTQNARINSADQDPDRGGICGYQQGVIRYSVNMQSIDCNWNYIGGITGECDGGKIEYCLNRGQVSGGADTRYAGGVAGGAKGDSIIFCCRNDGYVYSTDDDDIGGIVGEGKDGTKVFCCINTGTVKGDDRVGGICGTGWARYSFNTGMIHGDDDTGAVAGESNGRCDWCRGLLWTSGSLCGSSGDNGSEWISAEDAISGKLCWDLNSRDGDMDLSGYGPGYDAVFCQNIGGDPVPAYTGQKVTLKGSKYTNSKYEVRVEYNREYGEVKGAGSFESGKVTLEAVPAEGCIFDHFELSDPSVESRAMHGGNHDYPSEKVESSDEKELTLTDDIDRSYMVKAVFDVFDDTPEDMKQRVKIELECTNDADGWNGETIPVYLIDSSNERHLWEVNRTNLDNEGDKASYTYDIGAASPVSLEAWPDFGGGVTFRDYGLKARMWINDSEEAIESGETVIRSWPFASSIYGNDYMSINFRDMGKSSIGVPGEDGSFEVKQEFTSCKEAWEAAKAAGEGEVLRLDSAWILDSRLVLDGNKTLTLDLNGYPVIRPLKRTIEDGEVIKIGKGAQLNVIDSDPSSKTSSAFTGGSIQGGRSTNGAGIIDVDGTLRMTGGALYNGGTTDDGGAIRSKGGSVDLKGAIISGCWSSQARFRDNEGGGIYLSDGAKAVLSECTVRACSAYDKGGGIYAEGDGTAVSLTDTNITACAAEDDGGGAIYQDGGSVEFVNGSVDSCRTDDDGGGLYQNEGEMYVEGVTFGNNSAEYGGAVYKNTDDQAWFIKCTFRGNTAAAYGGAVYVHRDGMYMDGCALIGNACEEKGGAMYVSDSGSIDLCGKTTIKDNDGGGTMNNLVMEKGAYIYDAGLTFGSEVHVRSAGNGNAELAVKGYEISEYQLRNCFVADAPEGLTLHNVREEETRLHASAFSNGTAMLVIGVLVLLFIAFRVMKSLYAGKKGERS